MTALLLCTGLALAQAPTSPPSLTAPPIPIEAVAQTWWLVQDVELQRWPDGGPAVEALKAGTEVELILTDGDKSRVRKDLSFGWVPSSAVSTQPPATPPAGG